MTVFWIVVILAVVAYASEKRRQAKGALDLPPRVTALERQLAELRSIVEELRDTRRAPAPEPAPIPGPEPSRASEPYPSPTRPVPSAQQVPPVPASTHVPPRRARQKPAHATFDWARTLSSADLLGAKALAFAGGVVTLLGVVFFFVLAVNRGWIGPGMRVACGGLASAIVFGSGIWLRHRFGRTYSALAAAGTGIAGGYTTLLAAVSLYDMISKPVALVVAGAIASVGVAISLAWDEEIVAGFGLIGAMIVPATLVFQGGLQEIGTAFVAVVFAGAAVVSVRRGWWTVLRVAAVVSAPQALAQIADAGAPHPGIVTLAVVFWLLYVAAGLANQLEVGRTLATAPASFLVAGAVFAGVSAALIYDGVSRGIALLVIASVYIVVSAALYRRARESATLMWALGLTVGAVGVAQALSGSSLTYAWAAEAALLAWLSARVRDSRLRLPAFAYLGLALLHTLSVDASSDPLFRMLRHPAASAPAAVAVALAAIVFTRVDRSWTEPPLSGALMRQIEPLLQWLREREARIDATLVSLAAGLSAYAASLGVLELFQAVWPEDGIRTPFEWGQVAVTAMWSLAALLVLISARRGWQQALAFAWLGLAVVKALTFDQAALAQTPAGVSLLVVGTAALVAGLFRESAPSDELTPEGTVSIVLSLGLLLGGAIVLVPDHVGGSDGAGVVLVAAGALYSLLAAGAFLSERKRDLSTLLWLLGLGVAAIGADALLDGVWLVLAYTILAAGLAAISVLAPERRLQVASLVYIVLAALPTFATEAPLTHLVSARIHPGHGLPSLLLLIGALAVFAWALGWSERNRLTTIWITGALAVYTASLAILEAAQRLSPGTVNTDFQRGHTAVSAFWGILALVSLYVGLKRRTGLLRGGGFILFAVSLGKIFLFDLPSLSSAQRALSFLAVGAVLLLGGFFYQRLSSQFDDRAAI